MRAVGQVERLSCLYAGRRHWLMTLFVALLFGCPLCDNVRLAALFSDHAVLQRNAPVPVWGQAAAGEPMAVSYRGKTVRTQADRDGRWLVRLEPMEVGPAAELVVEGTDRIVLTDVVVGEVWLASGQSNMEFSLWNSLGGDFRVLDAEKEVATAQFPQIRHFKVEKGTGERKPSGLSGAWTVCTPATVGNFSAVGFFFARELQVRTGVPIGILNCSWGGTPIEAWMSEAILEDDPAFAPIKASWAKKVLSESEFERALPAFKQAEQKAIAAWLQAAPAERKERYMELADVYAQMTYGPDHPFAPSAMFDAMLAPVIPYAIRGAIWYQGECNTDRPSLYQALFSAMIIDWRKRWHEGEFPFLWVQLPNFDPGEADGTMWAQLREAQARTLALPNTGMAVTIDVGEDNNAHPRNKQAVGHRLALIACSQVYGLSGRSSGPAFKDVRREGHDLRVNFDNVTGALAWRDGIRPPVTIAGADGRFFPANVHLEGASLLAAVPEVPAQRRFAMLGRMHLTPT